MPRPPSRQAGRYRHDRQRRQPAEPLAQARLPALRDHIWRATSNHSSRSGLNLTASVLHELADDPGVTHITAEGVHPVWAMSVAGSPMSHGPASPVQERRRAAGDAARVLPAP
jgi:hypothetical protein